MAKGLPDEKIKLTIDQRETVFALKLARIEAEKAGNEDLAKKFATVGHQYLLDIKMGKGSSLSIPGVDMLEKTLFLLDQGKIDYVRGKKQ